MTRDQKIGFRLTCRAKHVSQVDEKFHYTGNIEQINLHKAVFINCVEFVQAHIAVKMSTWLWVTLTFKLQF